MDLLNKHALVTGAGRGIGKGCAIELARRGADIIVNDQSETSDLAATVAEIGALGRSCTPMEADVFSREGCESLVAAAIEVAGRIDILISNPAFSRRGDFLDYDPELFERSVSGTLSGGFHMSQLVARHMVDHGNGGKIVFISSVQASIPYGRSTPYNAAKAGLNHMARTIAAELCQYRINVNVIEPGWIDTPGERETFGNVALQAAAAKLPWGRLGTPSDIGRAAAFLASDDADYITGTILRVDGGFVIKDCVPDALPKPRDS